MQEPPVTLEGSCPFVTLHKETIFLLRPCLILKKEIPSPSTVPLWLISVKPPIAVDFRNSWLATLSETPGLVPLLPSLLGRSLFPHQPSVATAECPW